jgi:hypothetical protein
MSYQGWACSIWIVDDSKVEEKCPEEHAAFKEALTRSGMDMTELAYLFRIEDFDEDEHQMVWNMYKILVDSFERKTTVQSNGLHISLGYISDDDDSDHHGAIWQVEGVQTYTLAGWAFVESLEYLRWVEYG